MFIPDIGMPNGSVFPGTKVGELVTFIVNKFSEEGLTCDEAKEVLARTEDAIGGCSKVQKII